MINYIFICIHNYTYIFFNTQAYYLVRWYCRLNGHVFEQTPGDSEGQGRLSAAVHGVPKGQRLSD